MTDRAVQHEPTTVLRSGRRLVRPAVAHARRARRYRAIGGAGGRVVELPCPHCPVKIGPRGNWDPYDRLYWHIVHAHGGD